MGRQLLCVGRYAEYPYYLDKLGKNIYSIEELCSLLSESALLFDVEDFSMGLFNWMDTECGLVNLASDLKKMYEKVRPASEYAEAIMKYIGYNSDEEISKTVKTLDMSNSVNVYEKRMIRAGFLFDNGQYPAALAAYETLSEMLPDTDRINRADVYHNEGVIYSRLFLYVQAAGKFRLEYENNATEDAFCSYLAALRMSMTEDDYVNFIGSNKDAYTYSLKLEKRMNEASDLYALSDGHHRLDTLALYKTSGKMQDYYDEINNITDRLKRDYRNITGNMAQN